ncbi:energy-coupling factor transporter transmembrane component T [Litchfieldia alkalitelluris]|uniref:energy-coupling factor transporter transmembrane component T n=1 Tax=Litchfieldia alkalitelluris TaxID=304268 RepID=UPI001115C089|nr:energy-coupling factor transporter transmembrane component T [Litchfieldia alkalitelluris]
MKLKVETKSIGFILRNMEKTSLRFHFYHPIVHLIYFLGLMVLATLISHPGYLTIFLLLLIILQFTYNGGRQLKNWSVYIVLLLLFIIIINPLMNRRGSHILFYLGENPIMLEGLVYGIRMALSLVCILFIFFVFNVILTDIKLFYLFGKIAPKSALLSILTMRFVPLLKRRLNEIIMVQRRRAITTDHGKLKQKLRSGMIIIQVLLTWSLEDAIQTADSMKARGYDSKARSMYQRYYFTSSDLITIGSLLFLILIILFGFLNFGSGNLTIYPELQLKAISGSEVYFLLPFCLYISLPLLIELKEWIRWKFFA